jgi:hypothetical protein
LLRKLIEKGSNVEEARYGCLTALTRAVEMEDRELITVLLDHGADMHWIANEYQDIDSAFNQALLNGTLDSVAFFDDGR